jgi:RNA polymerase-binding transcription factor DksA
MDEQELVHEKCLGLIKVLEEGYGVCEQCGEEGKLEVWPDDYDDSCYLARILP